MSRNEFLAKMDADIERTGRSIMGVINGFFYTIGQNKREHPDIIISMPLDPDIAQSLLNDVCASLEKGELSEGKTDKVLRGMDAYLLPCTTNLETMHADYVIQADEFYKTNNIKDVKYWQLVLPDARNRFPWDSDYNSNRRMPDQPLFCTSPVSHLSLIHI